ncbi:MAG: di-trans,poly-cis-decaprenylcistransferase [Candidatus Buchananbacteria bacterium RIFCSPLOWO2_01_FULL_39_33]|uniref:Isoprenyl transferase n=1 Tax=Candidatus Buchananbacteria bacterium RIFCSPLOWO2_01_FULL_39_33 TaxID=1797543 RepID=A0A1G1YP57_9BACT|nr:MAG: di-trans,poly-cis-decaprenylcistransferase [Candidatus Buchananbacteria bacterium RIFCSPHIGHO2_01_FULL_40_35]OGY53227.1 MAG: di-trans,poly-cis-decaprenylcistransferase [Candidatus Buchananbacteria bacterium RIFCSPLOWO2_01_FULL_39_33]
MQSVKHIAFIMDGNRRWAKQQGLPTLEGHRRGYNKMKQVGDWCLARGIRYMTVFAFSTENWKRSKKEVDYLMRLLEKALTKELHEFTKRGIRLRVIGSRDRLSKSVVKAIDNAEKITVNNKKGILNMAINYGGRLEIIEAVKKIIKQKKSPADITEELIDKNIWTAGQPDPDIIVRTSGEQRLSGFLTWQSVYSELFFVSHHWPAFSEKDLDGIIDDYNNRHRRFGGN